MKTMIKVFVLIVSLTVTRAQAGQTVIIGHENVPKMDASTIQKIYTGKIISVASISITPVAFKPGTPARTRFLREFLRQDEDKYTAYWTVRRYIGKGIPPTELSGTAEVVRYVVATPGAIGYLDADELPPGLNVILRK